LSENKFDLINLVELQLLEKNIIRKANEISLLKKSEKLQKMEVEFSEISATHESISRDYSDIEHEKKKLEDSISLNNEKIKKHEAKLFSGTITSSKELVNFQEEIKQSKLNNDGLESKEIELMIKVDEYKPKLKQAEAAKQAMAKDIESLKVEIGLRIKEIDERLAVLKERRKTVMSKIPNEVRARYDEVKAKKGGVGVAVLKNRVCDVCRMEISSGEAERILDPDVIHKCPECKRMLIISNESIENLKVEIDAM
jgi:predicted  nucleic acid-binding Zn-ribbon protein